MRSRKRGADALTRSLSNTEGRTCIDGGEAAVSSVLVDDFNCRIEDVQSHLGEEVASVVRKSVVLLILTNGMGALAVTAGIVIECHMESTKVVTTSALINPLLDNIKDPANLKIEVHHEGVVLTGLLEEYDLDLKITVVKVLFGLNVCCVPLNTEMEFPCHRKAVAIFGVSGTLRAAYVPLNESLIKELNKGEHCDLVVLFDLHGNFAALILEGLSLSRRRIRQLLQALRGKERVKGRKHNSYPDACRYVLNKYHIRNGYRLDYPMPPRGDMILVNAFEEPFGDAYPKGVWTTFKKTVRSAIDQNVVSVASFMGNTRFFACTGFFIDFNECTTVLTSASLVRHPERPMQIVDGLEIKVLLPSQIHMEGTLLHFNLRYNVALISVKNFRACHTVNLDSKTGNISSVLVTAGLDETLVAVGRCFESGVLMAANGEPLCGSGSVDCEFIFCSSCKITKAGIGGPLVDTRGKFMGMNFYDGHIGTYLLREDLSGVLKCFKTKETTYERGFGVSNIDPDGAKPVSWPVLKPHWCHPDRLKEDAMLLHERRIINSGPYMYDAGRIRTLK